ncbi:hypothetical protein HanRHA438_Chr13g0624091 [Helianthus annuus]|nr:hypothetical protein HanRHA438_Chr13g0624091 [Helianthus annuus]
MSVCMQSVGLYRRDPDLFICSQLVRSKISCDNFPFFKSALIYKVWFRIKYKGFLKIRSVQMLLKKSITPKIKIKT